MSEQLRAAIARMLNKEPQLNDAPGLEIGPKYIIQRVPRRTLLGSQHAPHYRVLEVRDVGYMPGLTEAIEFVCERDPKVTIPHDVDYVFGIKEAK